MLTALTDGETAQAGIWLEHLDWCYNPPGKAGGTEVVLQLIRPRLFVPVSGLLRLGHREIAAPCPHYLLRKG